MKSSRLLTTLGILWLLAAGGLLIYQLAGPVSVHVEWTTATELNTAGFNLYRSTNPDGDFLQINDAMIASQGTPTTGSSYTYIDRNVSAGQTYYYVLEEIELNAATHRYEDDMFAYNIPRMALWAVVATAVTTLIGLALLFSGLREVSIKS